jgi:methyl-accepting chemotaxis protein
MLKDLSVRKKLMLGFGTTTLTLLLIGIFAIAAMQSMKGRDDQLFRSQVRPMSRIARYAMEYQQIRVELGEIAADTGGKVIDTLAPSVKRHFLVLDTLEAQTGPALTNDSAGILFRRLVERRAELAKKTGTILKLVEFGVMDDATRQYMEGTMRPMATQVSRDLDRLIDLLSRNAQSDTSRNIAQARMATLVLVAVIALSLGLSVLIGLGLAGTIVVPLRQLAKGAADLREGRFAQRMNLRRGDEIGQLADTMDTLSDTIEGLLREVGVLSRATIEGRLHTRGDSSRYKGEFERLVGGINGILDALTGLIDELPLPLLIVDRSHRVSYISRSGADLVGRPAADCLDAACHELIGTVDCRSGACAGDCALRESCALSRDTTRDGDGRNLRLSLRSRPLHDREGRPIGMVEVFVDETPIHEMLELNQSLAEQQAREEGIRTEFQQKEVDRLTRALDRIAHGRLVFDLNPPVGDEYTMAQAQAFGRIHEALGQTVRDRPHDPDPGRCQRAPAEREPATGR